MTTQPGDRAAAVARRTIAQGQVGPTWSQARPRLAVFDIDGTLLDPAGELRPQVRRAVQAVAGSGTRVMLATGRSPWAVIRVMRDLGLTGPQVTMNGGVFADPITGEIVWARRLSHDLALDAVALARELGTRPLANFIHRHVAEAEPDGSMPADLSGFVQPSRLHLVRALEDVAGYGPIRIYIPTGPERHARAVAAARELFDERASVVWGDEDGIEILAPGTNKGAGVRIAAESAGIAAEDVAAAGDAPNDLEMLAWAGHSAAMGNAPADVRAAARHLVPSAADDGLLEAIRLTFPDLPLVGEPDAAVGATAA